jgi:predicted Holliday junction resolvase-like endonuclease
MLSLYIPNVIFYNIFVDNCEFRNYNKRLVTNFAIKDDKIMNNAKKKRYCLQKLVKYNRRTKEETWKDTEYCSEKIEPLLNFMPHTFRIVDRENNNREVKRNFDPSAW